MRDLKILIVIGPTGVGKTTLIKDLGMPYVPSDVTRIPRPGEQNGVDYNFRNDYDQILKDIHEGKFVQIAVGSGGDFYGTKESSYPESGPASMAVVADVVPVFRQLGFGSTISVFITPPSYEAWMGRLQPANIPEYDLVPRLAEAVRSFKFALQDKDTHFILNDLISDAQYQLRVLVDGQPDLAREEKARGIAEQLLARLQLDLNTKIGKIA